jgi:opacity protein-like surface antigen
MTSVFRVSCVAAIASCVLAGGALAADFPVKAPPAFAPVVYNWSGLYVGAHLGYGQAMKDWVLDQLDYDARGFLGGGQVGVNAQIGNWVIGAELDASWTNIKGSQTTLSGGPLIAFTQTRTATSEFNSLATAAMRLGFAQDRWLVYVKGGAAWARETHTLVETTETPGVIQTATLSASENRYGAMLGIGTEVALWGNWSFKSEYNYIRFEPRALTLTGTSTGGIPVVTNIETQQTLHLAKFGVNYRFGPNAPPAIAPSRAAPGYDWTGAYIGVQAGYGFGQKDWPDFSPNGRFDVQGWIAGGTTGLNVQAGVFVVGAESEWLWSGIKGARRFVQDNDGSPETVDLASKVSWLSLNSLRVGFVPADRWLVYGKGGVAFAKETHDYNSLTVTGAGTINSITSGSALHTGWLGGAGVEYAFLGNWSAKLEYNYIHFRMQDVTTTGLLTLNLPPTVGSMATIETPRMRQDMHLVKFGINYHFSSIADVITARY